MYITLTTDAAENPNSGRHQVVNYNTATLDSIRINTPNIAIKDDAFIFMSIGV